MPRWCDRQPAGSKQSPQQYHFRDRSAQEPVRERRDTQRTTQEQDGQEAERGVAIGASATMRKLPWALRALAQICETQMKTTAGTSSRNRRTVSASVSGIFWKLVLGDPKEPIGFRLEATDEQIVEPLVVTLYTSYQIEAQVLLDADHRVYGHLVTELQLADGREVDEIVGLDKLLVTWALCVQPERGADAPAAAEGVTRGDQRRDGHAPIDGAPIYAQTRLDRHPR